MTCWDFAWFYGAVTVKAQRLSHGQPARYKTLPPIERWMAGIR